MLPKFPEFYKLSPDDRDLYNQAIADYPPYSDILFSTLHIWWNLYEQLAVCNLNDNVVIRYHLPFDKESSGYCVVGKNHIDESISTLFEHLRKHHEPMRLVHVPEFTIKSIKHPDKFIIKEETDYNEYILDSEGLAKLEGSKYGHIRTQINRFMRETEHSKLEYKELDLSLVETQDHLLKAIKDWEAKRPAKNDPEHREHGALKKTLEHAATLDIESLALYIDDRLHGFVLYEQTPSKDHFVIHHLRFDYSIPYTSDHLTRHLANKAVERNVPYINMEMDLGIENLRHRKMKLRPLHFFRKYTVSPAK